VKQKGFTLVELLILVAMVAILTSILFPVFSRAAERARKRTCLNNCKQIALACLMYAEDNDETLPVGYLSSGQGPCGNPPNAMSLEGYPMSTLWCASVLPYVESNMVFHCPLDQQGSDGYSYAGVDEPGGGAMMCWYTWDSSGGQLSAIDDPAHTIMILCQPINPLSSQFTDLGGAAYFRNFVDDSFPPFAGRNGNVFNTGLDWKTCTGIITESSSFFWETDGVYNLPALHHGGTNYGYCDGHVAWHKLTQTLHPRNQWTRDGSD
jgi:prepilin-type N-terminal cleavage/methylation domain-containing protein/prepilin-type processing-associated H-X9-DG protein